MVTSPRNRNCGGRCGESGEVCWGVGGGGSGELGEEVWGDFKFPVVVKNFIGLFQLNLLR